MPTPRDPRWILLVENGEYSSLSRYREPDDEDFAIVQAALEKAGKAGWIAVMSHSTYEATVPEVVMVKPVRETSTPFEDAVAAFRRRLNETTAESETGKT